MYKELGRLKQYKTDEINQRHDIEKDAGLLASIGKMILKNRHPDDVADEMSVLEDTIQELAKLDGRCVAYERAITRTMEDGNEIIAQENEEEHPGFDVMQKLSAYAKEFENEEMRAFDPLDHPMIKGFRDELHLDEEMDENEVADIEENVQINCPISGEIMDDAVQNECGHTFSLRSVQAKMGRRHRMNCPIDGCDGIITKKSMREDPVVRLAIRRMQERANEEDEEEMEIDDEDDERVIGQSQVL
eukprot:TRINITY_DN779777_c0_g1_i1.p1 TRINITY_DN779777_c0_g1~~TRINITY_DN779777_c0_g1_i1.p1  ORF type:complete len:246 (+),score=68.21 TRINITY_DN779777_c0_g1_i1:166-903(+)